MKKILKKSYLALVLLFLYAPIVVLIVQSFNSGKSRAKWEGFSLHWYVDLFGNASIMNALWVTVSVAVIATICATILGTLAAIGIYSMKKRPQALPLGHRRLAPAFFVAEEATVVALRREADAGFTVGVWLVGLVHGVFSFCHV